MNLNEKIRRQARMNAEVIQGIVDEAETGNISISGLLVIREDIMRMLRLFADEAQRGDDQAETLAYIPQIKNVVTELGALNEKILTMINDVTNDDKGEIVEILKRLKIMLLQLVEDIS